MTTVDFMIHNRFDKKMTLMLEPVGETFPIEPGDMVVLRMNAERDQPNFEMEVQDKYFAVFVYPWASEHEVLSKDGTKLEPKW